MKLELTPEDLWASPGSTASVQVRIINDTEVIDGYSVEALHRGHRLAPDQVGSYGDDPRLFPGKAATVELPITPDRTFEAGCHEIAIVCRSEAYREREPERASLRLNVTRVDDVRLSARPSIVRTRRGAGEYSIAVDNRGNTVRHLRLTGEDAEGLLTFAFVPAQLEIAPGATEVVRARASVGPPWFGTEARRELLFGAEDRRDPNTLIEPISAQLIQRPRIPQAVIVVLAMLIGFGFWTLLFAGSADDVNDEVNEADLTDQELLDDFRNVSDAEGFSGSAGDNAGATDGAGAGGGGAGAGGGGAGAASPGTISGSVEAATDGSAIAARVSVYRADDASTRIRTVRAAADGFEIGQLPPGDYLLRLDAPGFIPVWFPDAATADGASPVSLDGATGAKLGATSMQGAPGSVVGLVTLPGGATEPSAPIEVELRPAAALPTEPPLSTATVDADRRFELTGLASPADYRVTLVSPAYRSLTVEVSIGAGATVVLDAVDIEGGNGVIAGLITSDVDGPLPGATITVEASDAPLRIEATSPTDPSDAAGRFRVDRLRTPGIYTLTFRAPDHESRTERIVLVAGQQIDDLSVELTSNAAVLDGTLLTGGGGGGGVVITVAGAPTSPDARPVVRTAVSTPGDGDNGSFRVDGIVGPGRYTITYSRPDLFTASRQIDVVPGLNDVPAVTLDVIPPPPPTEIDVNVRLVGAAGQPISLVPEVAAPAFVSLSRSGDGRVEPTDTDGLVAFGAVGPGWYRLSLIDPPPGFGASRFVRISEERVQTGTPLPVELRLRRDTYRVGVDVTVVNAPEEPFNALVRAGLPVVLVAADGSELGQLPTNADGQVVFDDLLPGSYTVEVRSAPPASAPLLVTDASVATLVFVRNARPIAVAGPDRIVLDGDASGSEQVAFDGSASRDPDGTIETYEWLVGGSVVARGATASLSQDAGTTVTYQLRVTDNLGFVRTDDVIVTVNSAPVAAAVFATTLTEGGWVIQLDGSASFDPDPNDTITYEWTQNATIYSTSAIWSQPWPAGTYTFTLTVTDGFGATDTIDVVGVVPDGTFDAIGTVPGDS